MESRSNSRLPKQALFVFWQDHGIRPSSPFKQGTWLKQLLAQIQQSEMDWFRVAQDRQAWHNAVLVAFQSPPQIVIAQ